MAKHTIVPANAIEAWLKAREAQYVKQAKKSQEYVYRAPAGVWFFVKPSSNGFVVREQVLGSSCGC